MTDTPIQEIPATELKAMLDRGEAFQLIDVRSPAEREIATIPTSRMLDEATYQELTRLDPETPLVFTCHHGERSRAAAAHFRALGFEDVRNVFDGIDGWSLNVDPTVRRY